MKSLYTIDVTVYRGAIEPIIEQRQCKVSFYPNHLEYVYDYDYRTHEDKVENLICATLIPKDQISIDLTQGSSESDLEQVSMILIKYNCNTERIYMENMDKAEKMYSSIKKWLIS